ncbi:NAD kinase [Halalkalibacterium halodurans]|uniref:NAD kinase n=1 Tax=Halalkalibacterium halodurans TaxID=86665 RepID=UPI0010682CA9|nr:NAD kinase [Halalkalibacterium halodurans]MED3647200.1 NAD kinase [Halalkalibacterium halodurans]TES58266.1 NAD kinase [Halalkalibacterium halodurans]
MEDKNNIYFFYKHTKSMQETVEPLKQLATSQGLNVVDDVQKANIIVSVGGNNAFLQATRKTNFRSDCLYVGVSTDREGFYPDFTINEIDKMFEAFENQNIEVKRLSTLEVTIDDEKPFYCLNECSIRSNVIKTFVLEVFIDDMHFETFRGDGMIVSTPTGSTAYNKSVRGAVVDPRLPSLQVSEIASLNNNTYRTLGTSFLLSGDRTLRLKVVQDGNDFPIIGADNEALSIRHAEDIKIRLSDKQVKVLKLKDNTFWHKVQRNFL